jgi:hypothetical protein
MNCTSSEADRTAEHLRTGRRRSGIFGKDEAKAETKPEVKDETKLEAKADAKPEPKTEARPEAKAESNTRRTTTFAHLKGTYKLALFVHGPRTNFLSP